MRHAGRARGRGRGRRRARRAHPRPPEPRPRRADPLLVLPPEVLLKVCALLPPADLARLRELSRGWRDFAADEALWRDVKLNVQCLRMCPLSRKADVLRILLRAPCLGELEVPQCQHPKAVGALRRVQKVRKLILWCGPGDLEVPLLRGLAPHLEQLILRSPSVRLLEAIRGMAALRELQLHRAAWQIGLPKLPPQLQVLILTNPAPEHLRMLEGLTALRRLGVFYDDDGSAHSDPTFASVAMPPQLEWLHLNPVFPAGLRSAQRVAGLRRLDISELMMDAADAVVECPPLPPGHAGLRSLRLRLEQGEPETAVASMLSLIRAHAATLKELTVCNDDCQWSSLKKRLFVARQLQACGLKVLRRLKLYRLSRCPSFERCSSQLQALRDTLRHCGTIVECNNRCRRRLLGASHAHLEDSFSDSDQ